MCQLLYISCYSGHSYTYTCKFQVLPITIQTFEQKNVKKRHVFWFGTPFNFNFILFLLFVITAAIVIHTLFIKVNFKCLPIKVTTLWRTDGQTSLLGRNPKKGYWLPLFSLTALQVGSGKVTSETSGSDVKIQKKPTGSSLIRIFAFILRFPQY